jgi:hypothetical protein
MHLIARATKPEGRSKCTNDDKTAIEMYDHGRYFRMTGDVFDGHDTIENRQEAVNKVHGRWISARQYSNNQTSDQKVLDQPHYSEALTASSVMAHMRSSKEWLEISHLWDGDTSAYNGDHSAADMALCNHLAYFCNRNEQLMDELFRRSNLMRDKWDEIHFPGNSFQTYGAHTIHDAASTCRNCYSERQTVIKPCRPSDTCFISLYDVTGENTPEQDRELVEGILREKQVLLLAAPSKAGKTWLAVELMWKLATGGEWLKAHCEQCRVVYCNLEVSAASFASRSEKVRNELGISHEAARMVTLMNGRGEAYSAKTLVDAVLNHLEGELACVIVDCLYAIETGSENDAEAIRDMFAELNRLTAAGCSVVGIHHFPKGSSGMKASIDRMAGSSVFARSPDALLSLDPLDVDEDSDEGRELMEAGYKAYRLSFDLRDFKPRSPIDLIFTGTRFLHDVSGRLSVSHIKGSAKAGAARGGKKNAERNALEWDRKTELIRAAIADCESENIQANRKSVLERYNASARAYGLKEVSLATFRDWTKPGGQLPFHTEGGVLCPN